MGTTKFSARLKLARAKAGMTQDELAKKAEMTQSKISTYESEKNDSTPGLDAAAALAMALGVSLDWRVFRTMKKQILKYLVGIF